MDIESARRGFLIRLVLAPFGLLLLGVAIASRDWRLILFVAATDLLYGVRLTSRWSQAFPQRSAFLSRRLQKVSHRLSKPQKTAAGFVFSVLILAFLLLLFGFNRVVLVLAGVFYTLLCLRILWIISREGSSGTKPKEG